MDANFFLNQGPFTLKQIIESTSCEVKSTQNLDFVIRRVCPLDIAEDADITFCTNNKYLKQLALSKAVACFVSKENATSVPEHMIALVSDNPYYSYALAMEMFYALKYVPKSQSNLIAPNSVIADSAVIGAGAVIGDNAKIGESTIIEPGAVIGAGVVIGRNCRIGSNVTINFAHIGDKVVILPGAQIGQDGFGFATHQGKHKKILHVGAVRIGNDVEIGANTTIDRGVYNDTIIEDGVRIDNLVQLGHNVRIGSGSVIVSQAGIAGSSKTGQYCVIGGQVGIAGHVTLGNQVQIAAQGGVISDLEDGSIMGGTPCVPLRQWHKQSIMLKKLASGKLNDRK